MRMRAIAIGVVWSLAISGTYRIAERTGVPAWTLLSGLSVLVVFILHEFRERGRTRETK